MLVFIKVDIYPHWLWLSKSVKDIENPKLNIYRPRVFIFCSSFNQKDFLVNENFCLFVISRKLPPLVWIPYCRHGTESHPPGALSHSSGWRNAHGVGGGSGESTSLSELASRSSSSNAYSRSTCKGSPRTMAASRRMLWGKIPLF